MEHLKELSELKEKIEVIVGKIRQFSRNQGFLPIRTIGLTKQEDKVNNKYNRFNKALNTGVVLS